MNEADILYENDGHWIYHDKKIKCYVVMVNSKSFTHSLSDSAFPYSADGYSLAKARCDYLAKQKAIKAVPIQAT